MNRTVTVLASAARTVTPTPALELAAGRSYTDFISNSDGKALVLVLNMTVVGTGSVTLTCVGVDAVTGATWPLLAGAAVITNSVNVYRLGPGLTTSGTVVVSDFLPPLFRVTVTANNANAATYSVRAFIMG